MLSHGGKSYRDGGKNMHEMMMWQDADDMKWGENDDDAMKMHCQEMPDMKGCEMYKDTDATTMDHSMMDMSDPMQMSMADMGKSRIFLGKHLFFV